jgi:hypothetical protein
MVWTSAIYRQDRIRCTIVVEGDRSMTVKRAAGERADATKKSSGKDACGGASAAQSAASSEKKAPTIVARVREKIGEGRDNLRARERAFARRRGSS